MKKANHIRNELVIEGTRIGIWDWNVQTGETYFNERWAEIIGYTLAELEPISIQTWVSFAHPDDLEMSNEQLEKHFNGELEYYDVQTRMKHKNGTWIWVHDRGKVFEWDESGNPLRMCGSHIDITEQKELEIQLKRAIQEKNILLAEVHHRVKNNLQLIISFARIKGKKGAIKISEIEDSINSIASAHEAIYKSERFDKILIHEYLEQISTTLLKGLEINFQSNTSTISKEIDFLIPVGLILTELINNSIKHGFKHENTKKEILVNLNSTEKEIIITYQDSGIGYSPEFLKNIDSTESFGIIILQALVEQLDGKIFFSTSHGAVVKLYLPNKKLKNSIHNL
jgi:PAS domain S-box-containing protein